MLRKHLVEMGSAQIDSGEAVSKVTAWDADDGACKQAKDSGE